MAPPRGLSMSEIKKNAMDTTIGTTSSVRQSASMCAVSLINKLQLTAIAAIIPQAATGIRFHQAACVYPCGIQHVVHAGNDQSYYGRGMRLRRWPDSGPQLILQFQRFCIDLRKPTPIHELYKTVFAHLGISSAVDEPSPRLPLEAGPPAHTLYRLHWPSASS